jgi:hypothetical protein
MLPAFLTPRDQGTQAPPLAAARLCALWSVGAFLLSAIIVPSSARTGGRVVFDVPARLLGIATASVCAIAFLQCPRRLLYFKVLTFVLLVPALLMGMWCLLDYASSLVSQNDAVRYLEICRRVHYC